MGKPKNRRRSRPARHDAAGERILRAAAFCQAATALNDNNTLLLHLSKSYEPESQAVIAKYLSLSSISAVDDTILLSQLFSHIHDCGRHCEEVDLGNAVQQYQLGRALHRQRRNLTIENLRLSRYRPESVLKYLVEQNIKTTYVKRLSTPSPPLNYWVSLDPYMVRIFVDK